LVVYCEIQLRSADAPIAVGRSGMRVEKGVATSGLIGERLMVSDDPKMNSFCQRSWLPIDDPALQIKKNGRPISASNSQVTLLIGNNSATEFTGWNHGRKSSAITGTPLNNYSDHCVVLHFPL